MDDFRLLRNSFSLKQIIMAPTRLLIVLHFVLIHKMFSLRHPTAKVIEPFCNGDRLTIKCVFDVAIN